MKEGRRFCSSLVPSDRLEMGLCPEVGCSFSKTIGGAVVVTGLTYILNPISDGRLATVFPITESLTTGEARKDAT